MKKITSFISTLIFCFLPCNVAFARSSGPLYYYGHYDILAILGLCFFGLSLIVLSIVSIIVIVKLIKARTGTHLTTDSSLTQTDVHPATNKYTPLPRTSVHPTVEEPSPSSQTDSHPDITEYLPIPQDLHLSQEHEEEEANKKSAIKNVFNNIYMIIYPIITAVLCIYPIAIIDFNLSNVVKFIAMFVVFVLIFASPLLGSIIPIIVYIIAIVQCFTHNRPIAMTVITIILFLLLIVPKIIAFISSPKKTDD